MDRELLGAMIAEGLSLEKIGRNFGKHPSTVSYWLAKYGLEAAQRAKHSPRGALHQTQLRALVERRLSARQIAAKLGVSYSTVRYWLDRYGLTTRRSERQDIVREARAAGLKRIELVCRRHGPTEFTLEGRDYYRCVRCRAERVVERRQRVKRQLIDEAGGRCVICGYATTERALHFHHVDPEQKAFGLSERGVARSIKRARAEAAKCVLLCANCHMEVEAGLATLG
jgi:transposase